MKTLLVLLSLIVAQNAFAAKTYTHCQSISLTKDYQQIELQLSKEGDLQSTNLFDQYLSNKDGDSVTIEGLTSEIKNITLIDSFTKNHWGLGGRSSTFTKVYGVKLHLKALEAIGTEIQGCIPREINEMDAYTICMESFTVFDRQ